MRATLPVTRPLCSAARDSQACLSIDLTAPLAERVVQLARLPVLRSMTRQLLAVDDKVLRLPS